MAGRLEGKGAFHHRASTRPGHAHAVRMAEEGADIRRIVARKGDVRDRGSIKAALDARLAEFGKLDVVVANAGICTLGDTRAYTLDQLAQGYADQSADHILRGVVRF